MVVTYHSILCLGPPKLLPGTLLCGYALGAAGEGYVRGGRSQFVFVFEGQPVPRGQLRQFYGNHRNNQCAGSNPA